MPLTVEQLMLPRTTASHRRQRRVPSHRDQVGWLCFEQSGYAGYMRVAMEVPLRKTNIARLPVWFDLEGQAARIFTPGAIMSGFMMSPF
ncbi:hypothetical protein HPP92_000051 [Vanilla planifolia]|uniref:Uncharacterized protein n=1 Tax=Vanilla planifolia TaxID=51239 RepID=A0A835RVP2_VANPL|nr:hypothetical protein HPP92_000051 [Vanilla planifolia]